MDINVTTCPPSYRQFLDDLTAAVYFSYGITPFKRLPRKEKKLLKKLKERSQARSALIQYEKKMQTFRNQFTLEINNLRKAPGGKLIFTPIAPEKQLKGR